MKGSCSPPQVTTVIHCCHRGPPGSLRWPRRCYVASVQVGGCPWVPGQEGTLSRACTCDTLSHGSPWVVRFTHNPKRSRSPHPLLHKETEVLDGEAEAHSAGGRDRYPSRRKPEAPEPRTRVFLDVEEETHRRACAVSQTTGVRARPAELLT